MKKIFSLFLLSFLFVWSVFAQGEIPTTFGAPATAPLSNWGITAPTSTSSSFEQSVQDGNTQRWLDRWLFAPWTCGATVEDDKNYIILNTDVPFIWRCIKKEFNEWASEANVSNVFPKLMANLIRIVMAILIVGGFLWILVGGFMIAWNGAFGTKQTGVKLIMWVIAGLILLWASGIILNLINPNFFGALS